MTTETVPDSTYSRRWLILAVVGIAQVMVVLDTTVVNIALPSAQRALHFSNGDRQWVITAYALAFGSLLPLGGRIGDMFGRKPTFLVGLIGFAAISAIAILVRPGTGQREGMWSREHAVAQVGERTTPRSSDRECADARVRWMRFARARLRGV
jgi:predicted MFS family arabinose efflux permease